MSREEAKEKEKAEMSDKLRLEMAMKESAEVAERVINKKSPSHVTGNEKAASQPVDPWGAPPVEPKQTGFDPFAPAQKADAVTNSFGSDPWGSSSVPPQTMVQASVDPWGGSSDSTTSITSSASQATSQVAKLDPWGASANPPILAAPPSASNNQKSDPWGSNKPTAPPSNNNQTPNPWGSSGQANQEDPWNSSTSAAVSTDPWGAIASNTSLSLTSGAGDNFDPFSASVPPQNSNPLQGFNQLSLQPSQPAASLDLFSADVLVPQVTSGTGNMSSTNSIGFDNEEGKNKAGAFLGNNANLVNIDNLVTKPANHPYITMNTSGDQIGVNRNPFNQKGPSLSLNQMKTDGQNMFGEQNATVSNAAQPSTVPAVGFDMSVGTLHQGYGGMGVMQQGEAQPTANPFFAPQPIPMNPGNSSNQLLF